MTDFEGNLIGLIDDEGNELNFELLDRVKIGDEEYVALAPELNTPDEILGSDGDLVILKVVIDEELQEETFVTVDDEEELYRAFDVFQKRFDSDEDGELKIIQ